MSGLLHLPVPRQIATATPGITAPVQAELVNWAGVHLMLHKNEGHGVVLQHLWACSHELTGWRLATGPSPETALAAAICQLRANMDFFRETVKPLPILNPIVLRK